MQFQSKLVHTLNFGDSFGYIPKNWAIFFNFLVTLLVLPFWALFEGTIAPSVVK
jgi:hypothetical protein